MTSQAFRISSSKNPDDSNEKNKPEKTYTAKYSTVNLTREFPVVGTSTAKTVANQVSSHSSFKL